MFELDPGIDADWLAAVYRRDGRVRIRTFLTDPGPLHDSLRSRTDWNQVINAGAKVYELDRQTRAAMSTEKHRALDHAVFEGGQAGFQFRYESIRVDDASAARAASATLLDAFAMWLSGGAPRALLRHVCGEPAIDFADAQATLFSAGDLLTGHDDAVAGKNRHAAYVLGLNPIWRVEWGGLLIHHGADGQSFTGQVPAFNTLDLFRVPQLHSVSMVTRSAPTERLSVTGWLRSGHA